MRSAFTIPQKMPKQEAPIMKAWASCPSKNVGAVAVVVPDVPDDEEADGVVVGVVMLN